ncbi:MAG: hypothetical protein N2748_03025, partial [candidate division WOR-3 bacterium]|nr:hypothetical protein [candidate division WOR-3 bacterium]
KELTKIPARAPRNDSLLEEITNTLLTEYQKHGFFWTTISVDFNLKKNQIIFKVNENKPALIADVEFQGNEQIPTSKLKTLIKTNRRFSQAVLNNQINAILNYYQNNGLPFASIDPVDFKLDEATKKVSYALKIDEGKKVIISTIKFLGTKAPQKRMQNIFKLKHNSLYNADEIDRLLKKVNAHNFSVVNYHLVAEDPNRQDTIYQLQLELSEQNNQTISAAVAYLTEYKEFNGYFYLNLDNLFNSLRNAKLGWERYNRYTHFLLNYFDPYLFGFTLTGDSNQSVFSIIYSKTDCNLGLKLPVTDYLLINFYLGYNYTTSIIDIQNPQTIWLGQGLTLGDSNLYAPITTTYQIDYSTLLGTRQTSSQ